MDSRVELYADCSRGIYIPQYFIQTCSSGWHGITAGDAAILRAGPDHEHYWEAWDSVVDNARYTDADGHVWYLWPDGDLWVHRADVTWPPKLISEWEA